MLAIPAKVLVNKNVCDCWDCWCSSLICWLVLRWLLGLLIQVCNLLISVVGLARIAHVSLQFADHQCCSDWWVCSCRSLVCWPMLRWLLGLLMLVFDLLTGVTVITGITPAGLGLNDQCHGDFSHCSCRSSICWPMFLRLLMQVFADQFFCGHFWDCWAQRNGTR